MQNAADACANPALYVSRYEYLHGVVSAVWIVRQCCLHRYQCATNGTIRGPGGVEVHLQHIQHDPVVSHHIQVHGLQVNVRGHNFKMPPRSNSSMLGEVLLKRAVLPTSSRASGYSILLLHTVIFLDASALARIYTLAPHVFSSFQNCMPGGSTTQSSVSMRARAHTHTNKAHC